MKVISANIGHLYISKPPSFVNEFILKDKSKTEYNLSISDYKIEKNIQIITSVRVDIFSMEGRREILSYKCFVVVKLELGAEDISKGETLKQLITYQAFISSWPIFESKIKLLNDFQIESPEIPPQPTHDELLTLLGNKNG